MIATRSHVCLRASATVGLLALAGGTFVGLVPSAGATAGTCVVRNTETKHLYTGSGSNLQTAIDAAVPRTLLRVKGICVGNFSIAKDLKLLGRPTGSYPAPILDGTTPVLS